MLQELVCNCGKIIMYKLNWMNSLFLNHLPKSTILDMSWLKEFADCVLTLHQTTKFWTWPNCKAFANDKLNLAKMMIGQNNIVGKGENAGYQHFVLFPACFQTLPVSRSLKLGIAGYRVKWQTNDFLFWYARTHSKKILVTIIFSFFHNVLKKLFVSRSLKQTIEWKRIKSLKWNYICFIPQLFLTLILPFVTMDLFYWKCRARSACTYIQSDLALHSSLFHHWLFTTQSQLSPPWKRRLLKTLWETGENVGDQHFLLFPQCFLPFPKQVFFFNFSFIFLLSSANAFVWDQSKNSVVW